MRRGAMKNAVRCSPRATGRPEIRCSMMEYIR